MNFAVCCLWFCVFCKWEWDISKNINVKYQLWTIVRLNVLFKGVWDCFLIFFPLWIFDRVHTLLWPFGITMDNKEPWRINVWKKIDEKSVFIVEIVWHHCYLRWDRSREHLSRKIKEDLQYISHHDSLGDSVRSGGGMPNIFTPSFHTELLKADQTAWTTSCSYNGCALTRKE